LKLRFRANDIEYELDGDLIELAEFVRMTNREIIPSTTIPRALEKFQMQRRMPTPADIASFIQENDGVNLQHTVPEITQRFLGVTLDTRKDILLYNQIFARIQKAHSMLEKKAGRKFYGIRERPENGQVRGGIMVYRLEPDSKHAMPITGYGVVRALPEEPNSTKKGGSSVR